MTSVVRCRETVEAFLKSGGGELLRGELEYVAGVLAFVEERIKGEFGGRGKENELANGGVEMRRGEGESWLKEMIRNKKIEKSSSIPGGGLGVGRFFNLLCDHNNPFRPEERRGLTEIIKAL